MKWLLPILVLAEIVLVRGGVLTVGQAVLAIVLIEGALALIAARQAVGAVRRFRAGRCDGLDPWTAAEDAFAVVFPRPVARFLVLEPRVWVCLVRWATRRYRPGPDDLPYHGRTVLGTFLVIVTLTTPVEILLFEVLIPWAWLRWVVLVLAIYALIWMFGLYASLVVLPHRLEPEGLLLRYGVLNHAFIPYASIARVEEARRTTPGGREGLRVVPDPEPAAYLGMGGRTDGTIALREPVQFWTLTGPSRPVRIVHVAVNDPARLVAALQARTAAAPSIVEGATSAWRRAAGRRRCGAAAPRRAGAPYSPAMSGAGWMFWFRLNRLVGS